MNAVMDDVLAQAEGYFSLGWKLTVVYPAINGVCTCTSREACDKIAKHPIGTGWQKRPFTAVAGLRSFLQWYKGKSGVVPNIGILAGWMSGVVVVDIDSEDRLAAMEAELGELPATIVCRSGSGGRHLYFKMPEGVVVENGSRIGGIGSNGRGLDIRSDGGQAVLPPSIHANGNTYAWESGASPFDGEPPELPPAWVETIATPEVTVEAVTSSHKTNGQEMAAAVTAMLRIKPAPNESDGSSRLFAWSCRGVEYGLGDSKCVEAIKLAAGVFPFSKANYTEADYLKRVIDARKRPDIQVVTAVRHDPLDAEELAAKHLELRPPIIHGLLRNGESINIISVSKYGKSWLALDLALALATGRTWLESFETEQCRVLIMDNELHPETSADRFRKVRAAREISVEELGGNLSIMNLRGAMKDIFSLEEVFEHISENGYRFIILDALYRFMPVGTNENDNGGMTRIYDKIDHYASSLGCSFALVHHTTKGNQSGKSITDVGAGAGAQSRAVDTHLILRPHEVEEAVVIDAGTRSFAPIKPKCLRWSFPLWNLDLTLDPTRLKKERPGGAGTGKGSMAPDEFVRQFVSETPRARARVIADAMKAGLSERLSKSLYSMAVDMELAHISRQGSAHTVFVSTIPITTDK